jgi:hypothetical protein
MNYLAKFRGDILPCLIDAADVETAITRIFEETNERPIALIEIPPGVLFAEVKFSTRDELEELVPSEAVADDEENPANHSQMGVVLEPFEAFADWLEAVDDAELGVAPTEAPPAEEGAPPAEEGAADGG